MRALLPIYLSVLLMPPAAGAELLPAEQGDALAALETSLQASPEDLELRWRLMRALYYRADFAAPGPEAAEAAWRRGRELAQEGIRQLEAAGSAPHDLPPAAQARWLERSGLDRETLGRFYFWASVHYGGWGRSAGLLTAAREGIANQIHAFVQVAQDLAPAYERGGPHRMMSTLHRTLPRVPFLTGWVDRARALPEVERALGVAPDDPGNRYLWALTVIAESGRSEAVDAVLEDVARLEPRPGLELEDIAVRDAAREMLGSDGSV